MGKSLSLKKKVVEITFGEMSEWFGMRVDAGSNPAQTEVASAVVRS